MGETKRSSGHSNEDAGVWGSRGEQQRPPRRKSACTRACVHVHEHCPLAVKLPYGIGSSITLLIVLAPSQIFQISLSLPHFYLMTSGSVSIWIYFTSAVITEIYCRAVHPLPLHLAAQTCLCQTDSWINSDISLFFSRRAVNSLFFSPHIQTWGFALTALPLPSEAVTNKHTKCSNIYVDFMRWYLWCCGEEREWGNPGVLYWAPQDKRVRGLKRWFHRWIPTCGIK